MAAAVKLKSNGILEKNRLYCDKRPLGMGNTIEYNGREGNRSNLYY